MFTIDKVIDDIIALKVKHHLLEDNWSFDGQVKWLQWAIPQGLVIVAYVNGELKGYMEFVRLDKVPTDIHKVELDYDRIKVAPVAFATQAISDSSIASKMLKAIFFNVNKDASVFVWHRKHNNKWKIFNRKDLRHEE